MSTKKEERSEYLTMYVTPSVAQEFKSARDNNELQDKVIKRFVTNETDWLKDEIQGMDEDTLRYRAKLLTIKDSFTEVQDVYVKEIEALSSRSYEAFVPIQSLFTATKESIRSLKNETEQLAGLVKALQVSVGYVGLERIEKLVDLVDRFNKITAEEKTLVSLIINNPKA